MPELRLNDAVAVIRNAQEARRVLKAGPVAAKPYNVPDINDLQSYPLEPGVSLVEAEVLEARLREFGIAGKVENIVRGPVVSRYEVRLAPGVKLSKIRGIAEDISVALAGRVRILAPIPGTSLIGLEVINSTKATVGLRNIIETFDGTMKLPIALGVDTCGMPKVVDLADMPHLLVAGVTGSGKSVFLNCLILSLIYARRPEDLQLVLVDPKRVELSAFKGIPHLLRPPVTEPREALEMFVRLVVEMERRYKLLELCGVRNIESYNALGEGKLPYIVCVVDEMADLMMTSGKALEDQIVRLAQMARAVGIHLVIATQKPVVKVITGQIKSNMPSRIAFAVSSATDSRVILDQVGAEKLAGRGDMLLKSPGLEAPVRYHGAWVSESEVRTIVQTQRR